MKVKETATNILLKMWYIQKENIKAHLHTAARGLKCLTIALNQRWNKHNSTERKYLVQNTGRDSSRQRSARGSECHHWLRRHSPAVVPTSWWLWVVSYNPSIHPILSQGWESQGGKARQNCKNLKSPALSRHGSDQLVGAGVCSTSLMEKRPISPVHNDTTVN